MATFSESNRIGDVVKREFEPLLNRESIVIATGAAQNLKVGTVLGRITIGSATVAAKAGGNAANTGALTLDATTPVLAGAAAGVYTVRCIAAASNSGTFRVEDPAGRFIGEVAVGATFAEQVKFSIADGSQDFVVGEGFDITVAPGTGKYVLHDNAATDGSQNAAAVLLEDADATAADAPAIALVRGPAVVADGALIFKAGISAQNRAAAIAALAGLGIVARRTV
jgi:hypothetical protein